MPLGLFGHLETAAWSSRHLYGTYGLGDVGGCFDRLQSTSPQVWIVVPESSRPEKKHWGSQHLPCAASTFVGRYLGLTL